MNNLTLLIDGNWLVQSRVWSMRKLFSRKSSSFRSTQSKRALIHQLCRSLTIQLQRFPEIDNIILIQDGKSWRKRLSSEYKNNRSGSSDDLDWDLIFETFHDFIIGCSKYGILVSHHDYAEGDDWIRIWKEYLNSNCTNCLIWSSDHDLHQLLGYWDNNADSDHSWTIWYEHRSGLFLDPDLFHQVCSITEKSDDVFDILEGNVSNSPNLNLLGRILNHTDPQTIHYMNGDEVVLTKILAGDKSDNILPIIRVQTTNRSISFTRSNAVHLMKDLEISRIDDLMISEAQCEEIRDWISHHHKRLTPFIGPSFVPDLMNRLSLNKRLVWLDDEMMPDDVKISLHKSLSDYSILSPTKISEIRSGSNNFIRSIESCITEESSDPDSPESLFDTISK